jgi:hypothetical protein
LYLKLKFRNIHFRRLSALKEIEVELTETILVLSKEVEELDEKRKRAQDTVHDMIWSSQSEERLVISNLIDRLSRKAYNEFSPREMKRMDSIMRKAARSLNQLTEIQSKLNYKNQLLLKSEKRLAKALNKIRKAIF